MFGRSKISESDRLRAVYADQSDGELLRLHEERAGLTEAAQDALAEVLKQRGLQSYVRDEANAPFNAEEPPPVGSGPIRDDEVSLSFFTDTVRLRNFIDLLEEVQIRFRVEESGEDVTDVDGRVVQRNPGLLLYVQRSQQDEARNLLRKLVFANQLAESEAPLLNFGPPRTLTLLLTCDRVDALQLVAELSDAGISFYWRDGREDADVPGDDIIAIEVQAAQRDRAEHALQSWMAAHPQQAAGYND